MTSTIEVVDREVSELDVGGEALLEATVLRALYQVRNDGGRARVYCSKRQDNGCLEFGMSIEYASGSSLFIGCIQRTPGAEFEFHSNVLGQQA